MPVGVEGFQRERLIQARRARGLTAISLADMAGLGQATISQYEKGAQKPRQQNLDKLAELLNVPPGFFSATLRCRKTIAIVLSLNERRHESVTRSRRGSV